MAAGDITFYALFKQMQLDGDANANLSSGPVDFDADTISVAVLTAAFTPDTTAATTQKHWSDVLANEVATATAYTGPIALTGVDVTETGGVVKVDAADVTIALDAAGFTDGRWLVFFKNSGTSTTSPLIAVGDLGANKSIQSGPLDFTWNAAGLFTLS